MLLQLPAGHMERFQIMLMFGLEFLPLTLSLDALQLIISGLCLTVEISVVEQIFQLFLSGGHRFHRGFGSLRLVALGGKAGLQIFRRGYVFFGQIIDSLCKMFQVANFGFLAPCSSVPSIVVSNQ